MFIGVYPKRFAAAWNKYLAEYIGFCVKHQLKLFLVAVNLFEAFIKSLSIHMIWSGELIDHVSLWKSKLETKKPIFRA